MLFRSERDRQREGETERERKRERERERESERERIKIKATRGSKQNYHFKSQIEVLPAGGNEERRGAELQKEEREREEGKKKIAGWRE